MYKQEKFGVSVVTVVMKGIMPIYNCSRGLIWFDLMSDTLITYSTVKTKYTACHFGWAVWLSWTGNVGNIIVNIFFYMWATSHTYWKISALWSRIVFWKGMFWFYDTFVMQKKKLNLTKCSRGHAL
jgi:hypothetical protein